MELGFGNKWDSDEDEEMEINEFPPPAIDKQFRENVLSVKHNLYDSTVLKPKLGTPQAQSNNVINEYLDRIGHVYVLCLSAQKGQVRLGELNNFPDDVKKPLNFVLNWLSEFFKKNRVADTIPYQDYIRKNFKEFQFVQDNSFE